MAKKDPKETPMMKQYYGFKSKYPGALMLFRVGDFYETFGEDAVTASKILGITLTKRHNGASSEIELAGFPHHALDAYLPKLVRAGQRVAICDQIEDPKFAKKLVKRGVTELVTPGVSYNDNVLETNRNNYLAAIAYKKDNFGIAFLDISTGEFMATEGNKESIDKLLHSFSPSEVLFSKAHRKDYVEWFGESQQVYFMEDWFFKYDFAHDQLTQHFKTKSLKGFGIAELQEGIAAAGAILHYLNETQHLQIQHINNIARIDEDRYVWLDQFTIRNLELLFPQQHNGVSLVDILDKTCTPMGGRLIRKWIALPLKDKSRIDERLNLVECFKNNTELLNSVVNHLKQSGDIERLISKVASRRIKPRELLQIKKALIQIEAIRNILEAEKDQNILQKFVDQLNPCTFLMEKIDSELLDDPKSVTNEGGLIKSGINPELDELRDIVQNSKNYLEQARQNAIKETEITSLKIGYNKVFGFYLEVTNSHKHKVPKSWIRKQTLTSAERYITEELKIYEDKIVNAEEKINILEQRLFQELVIQAGDFTQPIQLNGRILAQLDCLTNFAAIALRYKYCRPTITDDKILDIKSGRHPVIEQQLPVGEYVPNDTILDSDNQQVIVITGPNMSGKSALLRQVALITLMAQAGSFVPADQAEIGLVDKIFTRVGASDNIAKGESTFMVEMMETASIMNNLSDRSLILMDEIGRGTSTYDGISIAWSILEFLHNHPKAKAKTLFATHYHELNELAKDFSRIKNFHVTVKEADSKIIFMRKLAEGGSEHSFGIHVAQLAGMPQNIVLRADEIMRHLESQRAQGDDDQKIRDIPKNNYQLSIFDPVDPGMERIKEILENIDINSLSPIEALLKLNEMKGIINAK